MMKLLALVLTTLVGCLPAAKPPATPPSSSESRAPAEKVAPEPVMPAFDPPPPGAVRSFQVGDAVSAKWSKGGYYSAHVKAVSAKGYVVRFDSDGITEDVADADVRKIWDRKTPDGPGFQLGKRGPYRNGDAVMAVWEKSGLWYEAHIVHATPQAVTVQFDLDGVEAPLPVSEKYVRHRIGGSGPYVAPAEVATPAPAAPAAVPPSQYFRVGHRVEVFWQSAGRFYEARVIAVNNDGSVRVKFVLDGIETNVFDIGEIRMK